MPTSAPVSGRAADDVAADAFRWPHPAFPGIVRYLEARAKASGSTSARALLREGTPEYEAFADVGWRPEPSHLRLVCGVYRDDVTVERLRGDWFVTLGDFDVV